MGAAGCKQMVSWILLVGLTSAFAVQVRASGAAFIPTKNVSPGVDMPVINLGCGSGLIGKNVTGAVSSWIEAGATGIDAAHIYSWSVGNGKIAVCAPPQPFSC